MRGRYSCQRGRWMLCGCQALLVALAWLAQPGPARTRRVAHMCLMRPLAPAPLARLALYHGVTAIFLPFSEQQEATFDRWVGGGGRVPPPLPLPPTAAAVAALFVAHVPLR